MIGFKELAELTLEWLTEVQKGNQGAKARLIEKYERGIRIRIRHHIHHAHEREDLYHEVVIALINSIQRGKVQQPELLDRYVSGITRNIINAHISHRGRRKNHQPINEELPEFTLHPQQQNELEKKERKQLTHEMLNSLPIERDRLILSKFYIQEVDKAEVCKELQIDSLHFNRVIFRAKERFKKLYSEFRNAKE